MDQSQKVHIEFWTKGLFPIEMYKAFFEKASPAIDVRYRFLDEKDIPSILKQ
jgi:hypothetical protein